ncbi:hypothetical protein SISSUDRAFT_77110 [Sistotremastrum suecicum HHB10207 ss-3]|uniref:Uncharacterized protein n=1 Tax=Sistotremastrum suecicum HHB10207 ss-3 TaxID=1314776 RepID=A0A166H2I6_9AGAM|nr:hypothetical protein SISSUDRAFT_77110 [Sistotremastrum suecicum HHB10207 ss-3]
MESSERSKWSKLLKERDDKINTLRNQSSIQALHLSQTTSQLLATQSKLTALQSTLVNLESNINSSDLKYRRAHDRVRASEKERDDLRGSVRLLTEKVENEGTSRMRAAHIILPRPIRLKDQLHTSSSFPSSRHQRSSSQSIQAPDPQPEYDATDEAYITHILRALTDELTQVRKELSTQRENYDTQLTFLEAQVAHRDALLERYIHSSPNPSPDPPNLPIASSSRKPVSNDTQGTLSNSPPHAEALQIIHTSHLRNLELEEEIRHLRNRLEEERALHESSSNSFGQREAEGTHRPQSIDRDESRTDQHSRDRSGDLTPTQVPAVRPDVRDTDVGDTTLDAEMNLGMESVNRLELEIETLRTRVHELEQALDHSRDHSDDSQVEDEPRADPDPKSPLPLTDEVRPPDPTSPDRELPDPPSPNPLLSLPPPPSFGPVPGLSTLHTQIADLSSELERLHTEQEHITQTQHQISEPSPFIEQPSFSTVLLIEEECIRLRKSEENARQELAYVKAELDACLAHRTHSRTPAHIQPHEHSLDENDHEDTHHDESQHIDSRYEYSADVDESFHSSVGASDLDYSVHDNSCRHHMHDDVVQEEAIDDLPDMSFASSVPLPDSPSPDRTYTLPRNPFGRSINQSGLLIDHVDESEIIMSGVLDHSTPMR